jgi:hypothetical protein
MVDQVEEDLVGTAGGSGNTPSTVPSQGNNGGTTGVGFLHHILVEVEVAVLNAVLVQLEITTSMVVMVVLVQLLL